MTVTRYLFTALYILLTASSGCKCKGSTKKPDPAKNFKLFKTVNETSEYKLSSNELQILLKEEHTAPVAALVMVYFVGSRDENASGLAHILEHMMFKGTERFNKEQGTHIPTLLQNAGAELNAATGYDSTVYYETLPAGDLELAVRIEADRMHRALLRKTDWKSERTVILNEFDRVQDSPSYTLAEAAWKAAFQKHPYGRSIIGSRPEIERATIEDLSKFYRRYYAPRNACLIAVGDFDSEEILKLISETFGTIPSPKPKPEKGETAEPEQSEARHTTVEKPGTVDLLYMAHKSPDGRHLDNAALDVLAAVLSRGKTSRLYQKLVAQGLAASVESSNSKLHDPGLFKSVVTLAAGTKHETAEQNILNVYGQIREHGITDEELDKAKNQLKTEMAFARDGMLSSALQLAYAASAGDWTLFAAYLDQIDRVTAKDVQRVANTYLTNEKMTVAYFKARGEAQKQKTSTPAAHAIQKPSQTHERHAALRPGFEIKSSKPPQFELAKRARIRGVNSIKVISLKTQAPEAVTLMSSFEGASYAQSGSAVLPAVVSQMLGIRTQAHAPFELQAILESRGASLSFSLAPERLRFEAHCLSEDVPAVISIAAESLKSTRFDAEEFEKAKKRAETEIRRLTASAPDQARSALTRTIYEAGHPNFVPEYSEQLEALEKLTLEDVRSFYGEQYQPRSMVVVGVGAVEAEALEQAVHDHFSDWMVRNAPPDYMKRVTVTSNPARIDIPLAGRQNTHVAFGHGLPLNRLSEAYLPLLVSNYILGGSFSSRLSEKIRDELGLTYTIRSNLSGVRKEIEGHWITEFTVSSGLIDESIAQVRRELDRYASEGTGAEELALKKRAMIGSYQVSLSTTAGLAAQILEAEELGLGLAYLDRYPHLINDVTLEQARAAARESFAPEKLNLVTSGGVKDKAAADNR